MPAILPASLSMPSNIISTPPKPLNPKPAKPSKLPKLLNLLPLQLSSTIFNHFQPFNPLSTPPQSSKNSLTRSSSIPVYILNSRTVTKPSLGLPNFSRTFCNTFLAARSLLPVIFSTSLAYTTMRLGIFCGVADILTVFFGFSFITPLVICRSQAVNYNKTGSEYNRIKRLQCTKYNYKKNTGSVLIRHNKLQTYKVCSKSQAARQNLIVFGGRSSNQLNKNLIAFGKKEKPIRFAAKARQPGKTL